MPPKVCFLYKTKMSGEERSLGTKNMLDHMKRCLPARASAPCRSDSSTTTSESDSTSSSTNLSSTVALAVLSSVPKAVAAPAQVAKQLQ